MNGKPFKKLRKDLRNIIKLYLSKQDKNQFILIAFEKRNSSIMNQEFLEIYSILNEIDPCYKSYLNIIKIQYEVNYISSFIKKFTNQNFLKDNIVNAIACYFRNKFSKNSAYNVIQIPLSEITIYSRIAKLLRNNTFIFEFNTDYGQCDSTIKYLPELVKWVSVFKNLDLHNEFMEEISKQKLKIFFVKPKVSIVNNKLEKYSKINPKFISKIDKNFPVRHYYLILDNCRINIEGQSIKSNENLLKQCKSFEADDNDLDGIDAYIDKLESIRFNNIYEIDMDNLFLYKNVKKLVVCNENPEIFYSYLEDIKFENLIKFVFIVYTETQAENYDNDENFNNKASFAYWNKYLELLLKNSNSLKKFKFKQNKKNYVRHYEPNLDIIKLNNFFYLFNEQASIDIDDKSLLLIQELVSRNKPRNFSLKVTVNEYFIKIVSTLIKFNEDVYFTSIKRKFRNYYFNIMNRLIRLYDKITDISLKQDNLSFLSARDSADLLEFRHVKQIGFLKIEIVDEDIDEIIRFIVGKKVKILAIMYIHMNQVNMYDWKQNLFCLRSYLIEIRINIDCSKEDDYTEHFQKYERFASVYGKLVNQIDLKTINVEARCTGNDY